MMLELHNVTIGQQIHGLSATVSEGNVLSIMGSQGKGKTTLLRALMGFLPIDEGHISIDGDYVPEHLEVPEDYEDVPTDYLWLLEHAVHSGKALLIIDEPKEALNYDDAIRADRLIMEAAERGATVVAVNTRVTENQVQL